MPELRKIILAIFLRCSLWLKKNTRYTAQATKLTSSTALNKR
jgi:hypothetical protein